MELKGVVLAAVVVVEVSMDPNESLEFPDSAAGAESTAGETGVLSELKDVSSLVTGLEIVVTAVDFSAAAVVVVVVVVVVATVESIEAPVSVAGESDAPSAFSKVLSVASEIELKLFVAAMEVLMDPNESWEDSVAAFVSAEDDTVVLAAFSKLSLLEVGLASAVDCCVSVVCACANVDSDTSG